jgi:hypothetical protein
MAQRLPKRPPSYTDPLNTKKTREPWPYSITYPLKSVLVYGQSDFVIPGRDEAKSRTDVCQRIHNYYQIKRAIGEWLPVTAVIVFLALVIGFRRMILALLIGFRRMIGAVFYDLFVYVLTLGIRLKKILNHALKEAADRTR